MLSSLIVLSKNCLSKHLSVESTKIDDTIIKYTDNEFKLFTVGLRNKSNDTICFCVSSKYKPTKDEKGFYCIDRVLYGNVVIAGFKHNKICGLTDKEKEFVYTQILPN